MIGAGIETVLRLEDIYDLRRVANLADAKAAAESWPADAALVDGVLLEGNPLVLDIPSYVLSGDAETGERLAQQVPSARGWLLKDASPSRMVEAIDRSLGIVRVSGGVFGTLGMVVGAFVVIVFVAALAWFLWRFFLS